MFENVNFYSSYLYMDDFFYEILKYFASLE